jgi:iron complex transport system ATP-binding protein
LDTFNVNGISFRYRDVDILKDVSFSVSKGEFLTLLGPNGTGKTTLMRLLAGILTPYEGTVFLDGVDMKRMRRLEIAKKIAVVSQSISIEFPFSVKEVVLMGRYPHQSGFKMISADDRRIQDESMALTDITYLKDRVVHELSAGELQRVLIARALCQTPSVILLDEPTSHLDINHQIELNSLIKKLNRDSGLTVLNISHDLNAASHYSDKVMLLKDSAIFMAGAPAEVITSENVKSVFNADVIVKKEGEAPYVVVRQLD